MVGLGARSERWLDEPASSSSPGMPATCAGRSTAGASGALTNGDQRRAGRARV